MRKSVPVELDKTRNLRLGVNAICDIEAITGKPISQLNDGAGFTEIRAILYCGLRWESKDITLEEVGEMMEESDLDYIGNKIGEAIELALPTEKKKAIHPSMKK